MGIGVLDLIGSIFKPAAELIDGLHTSDEEKLQHKERLLTIQAMAMEKAFDYERSSLESRANIVNSEAQSSNWLTSVWRPIAMLTMLILVVGDALGWLPNPLSQEAWVLLEIGIGGYVVGRSAEKITKTIRTPQ